MAKKKSGISSASYETYAGQYCQSHKDIEQASVARVFRCLDVMTHTPAKGRNHKSATNSLVALIQTKPETMEHLASIMRAAQDLDVAGKAALVEATSEIMEDAGIAEGSQKYDYGLQGARNLESGKLELLLAALAEQARGKA